MSVFLKTASVCDVHFHCSHGYSNKLANINTKTVWIYLIDDVYKRKKRNTERRSLHSDQEAL